MQIRVDASTFFFVFLQFCTYSIKTWVHPTSHPNDLHTTSIYTNSGCVYVNVIHMQTHWKV